MPDFALLNFLILQLQSKAIALPLASSKAIVFLFVALGFWLLALGFSAKS
ncbi:hypothetical protein [Flavobacterium algicola]|nr:hypothetical protein [Flavobacterium algicola]MCG9794188.1 hypothetical protein [Flavobacterium algicola]